MSGLFPRCEFDYSTRAPAYLRPLSGPQRLELAQIDDWRTFMYNKGFTRDGGAEVGASFMSGLFPRCEAISLCGRGKRAVRVLQVAGAGLVQVNPRRSPVAPP